MITLNAVLAACIHHHRGTHNICLQENARILDGTVHMGFRCKVHDHIRMLFFEQTVDRFTVTDVRLHETEIRIVHYRCQRRQIACISQLVNTDDPVFRVILQHVKNKIGSNKSGAAGHDYIHLFSSLSSRVFFILV